MRVKILCAFALCLMTAASARSAEALLPPREAQAILRFVATLDDAKAEAYVRSHIGQLGRVMSSLDMSSEDDRITVRYLGQIIVRGGCSARLAIPVIRSSLSKLKDDSVPLGEISLYPPTSTYGSLQSVLEEVEARPECPPSM